MFSGFPEGFPSNNQIYRSTYAQCGTPQINVNGVFKYGLILRNGVGYYNPRFLSYNYLTYERKLKDTRQLYIIRAILTQEWMNGLK